MKDGDGKATFTFGFNRSFQPKAIVLLNRRKRRKKKKYNAPLVVVSYFGFFILRFL